jgi:hypothetical protein
MAHKPPYAVLQDPAHNRVQNPRVDRPSCYKVMPTVATCASRVCAGPTDRPTDRPTGGYGLYVITELTTAHGVHYEGPTKTVWATIAKP